MKQILPVENTFSLNVALANVFEQMSDCFLYIGKGERFQSVEYLDMARTLYNMTEYISNYTDRKTALYKIKGIGKSFADNIIEFLETGTLKTFEELKTKVPFELLELLHIYGIGPATLHILHNEFGISTKKDLIEALQTYQLDGMKGFDQNKIEKLLRAYKLYKTPKRLLLRDAEIKGTEVINYIKTLADVEKTELAGSLRRKKETIGDIDIVIQASKNKRKAVMQNLMKIPFLSEILVKGPVKLSFLYSAEKIQVDCHVVNQDEYGAALLYYTGSKEHNIKIRQLAREKGYQINENGVYDINTHKRLASSTEKDIYSLLGLKYIRPERRLNNGEIERAMNQKQEYEEAIWYQMGYVPFYP